jgi:peptidoglycan biosynthesis protein MviN/MurJ (putative lipid II flippase)
MIAVNQFASNFESVIPGIVGIAIAQSAFSAMSQSAALRKVDRLRNSIQKSITYNLLLAIPGAVGLALCSNIAAWLMHLQPPVSGIFIKALLIYSIAVPFESTNHIILRSFYALKNTGWPALSSVTSGAVAVSTGFALIDSLGVYALAVAYIVGQISQTILLGLAFKGLVRRTMVE